VAERTRGIEVTFQRGNPMPLKWAVVCTVVGAAFMVAGYTLVPEVDAPGGDVLTYIIAAVVMVPIVLVALLVVFADTSSKAASDQVTVPDELEEPPRDHPGDDDPAIVAVVVGEGQPSSRAVAATVLGLADRGALDLTEHGDRVVLSIDSGAAPRTEAERLVLDDLRGRADGRGDVVGPPIWPDQPSWWRAFRRDARDRALAAQLIEPRIPFTKLAMVLMVVLGAIAMLSFWRVLPFVGAILLANGLTHGLARTGGYRLAAAGRLARRRWLAFGRYLERQGSLRDVGPAAVAVWGPNLAFGVLLGQADRVADVLSPKVARGDDIVPGETISQKTIGQKTIGQKTIGQKTSKRKPPG
jgi:hypothetical protein